MQKHGCKGHGRRWLALALVAMVLLGGVAAGVRAQEQVNITINEVDSGDFPRVTAYATVSDAHGRAITELGDEAFTLDEDGAPVEDLTVEYQENVGEPILLALVLDTSGSMEGRPLHDTQDAAVQLINELGPADEVTVLSFNTVVTTHVEFTTDKAEAAAAVEALTARGGTAFNDAAHKAVALLAARPLGRKAVVILTDGADTDSVLTIDDGIDAAQEASIPIYAVGFGQSIKPDVLERMAILTGGHFYQSPSSEEIGESFGEVAKLLRYQYVLRFTSSLNADGAQHNLRVETDVGGITADAEADFVAEPGVVTVEILAPTDGEEIAEVVTVQVRVEAPGEVAQVVYLLDGAELGLETSGDFSHEWDTAGVPLGRHILTARATDSAGNPGQTDVSVEVVEPVTVAFASPPEEELENLSGEVIVEVKVWALYGVGRVVFFVDGEEVKAVESEPYRFTWNTADWATGEHTLSVTAYDVNDVSAQDGQEVWVAFRGSSYGVWVAIAILLLAGGVIVPLAARRRRKMQEQPAAPAGPVGVPSPAPGTQPMQEAGSAVAWLVVEQGPEADRRWPLPLGETSLGRSRADNDIVIPSRTASRRHAVIRTDAAGCVYHDLQPTNPTLVNDKPIAGSHQLAEGDRIRIGDVVLRFSEEEKK